MCFMNLGNLSLKFAQSLLALEDQTASDRAAKRGNVMYSTVSSSLMYSVHTFACKPFKQVTIEVKLGPHAAERQQTGT